MLCTPYTHTLAAFLSFRPDFLVEKLLRDIFALYADFVLGLQHEMELLQRKFVEFVFQLPHVSLFDFGHSFGPGRDFRCGLPQMRLARVQILVHRAFEYSVCWAAR